MFGFALVAVLMGAQTARADFEYFSGSQDAFNKTVNNSKLPVAVLYTAPWMKGVDKEFIQNVRKFVEPAYRGKVRFILVDMDQNHSLVEGNPRHAFLDLLQIGKDSRNGKTSFAKSIASANPDDDVPGIRDSVDKIVTPVFDMSKEPVVVAIEKQQAELQEKIAIIENAIADQKCVEAYKKSITGVAADWLTKKAELMKRSLNLSKERDAIFKKAEAFYDKLSKSGKKHLSKSDFRTYILTQENSNERNNLDNLLSDNDAWDMHRDLGDLRGELIDVDNRIATLDDLMARNAQKLSDGIFGDDALYHIEGTTELGRNGCLGRVREKIAANKVEEAARKSVTSVDSGTTPVVVGSQTKAQ